MKQHRRQLESRLFYRRIIDNLLIFSAIFIVSNNVIKAKEFEQPSIRLSNFVPFYQTEPFTKNVISDIALSITSEANNIIVNLTIKNYNNNTSSQITGKDADIENDYVEVILDLNGDGNVAYGFRISPKGVINDFIIENEKNENRDWDGVWTYENEFEEGVWKIEISIPWSNFVLKDSSESSRLIRYYASFWKQETREKVSTPAISKTSAHFLSLFHPLKVKYQTKSEFQIVSYVAFDRDIENNRSDNRVGATLKWNGGNQALTYAYNPDFGQVESTELILNLSGIETFFSEKRQFFLDEQEFYSVQAPENLRIFHSPRIGAISGPNDSNLNIEHALKYYTNINAFEFSVLAVKEESLSKFSGRAFEVIRSRFSSDDLSIGHLYTQTTTEEKNRVSQVNSIDFNFKLNDDLSFFGLFAKSKIGNLDILNDVTLEANVNQKKQGNALNIGAKWDWSEVWSSELNYLDYDKTFDITDSGFVQRVNRKQIEIEVEFEVSDYGDKSGIDFSEHEFQYQLAENQAGLFLGHQLENENTWTLNDKRVISLETQYFSQVLDDTITRENNIVSLPNAYSIDVEMASNLSNGWSYKVDTKIGDAGLSGAFLGIGAGLTYRINDYISISTSLDRVKYDSYLVWDEENVLVEYSATETEFELFLDARINERHFIDLKLESIAVKAKTIQGYEAQNNGDLVISDDEFDSFSIGELAMAIRYRYHPTPLSRFFVVYSRGGENEFESTQFSSQRLIRNAYYQQELTRFFVKYEHRFSN